MIALLHIRYVKRLAGRKLVGLFACLLVAFSLPAFANTTPSSRTVPFERMQHGQYTIQVQINGSEPLKFMIDTAASRTSIFNKTKLRLELDVNDAQAFINGMTNSSYRPTSNVKTLSFGRTVFKDHTVIILEDWDKAQADGLDGILGMDVFRGLIFAFSHNASTVKISKRPRFSKSKYNRWKKIRLEDNPYPVDKFGLLFTYTQLGDLHIPTLVDTGASFSAINWMSVHDTSISKERRRLREEWTVQGSIGEFKPRMRVRLEETFIGGMKLKQHEFLVMNFDKFPVNKYGAYPLVIAGSDIFAGRDFTFDFINNDLYVAPKRYDKISIRNNYRGASRLKKRR
jgi:predicted aspartyl protease